MICKAVVTAVFAPVLLAQFSGLSSSADGSSVYFASTLRLKGAGPPFNGKIYMAGPDGSKLVRAHDPAPAPIGSGPCTSGGFSDYLGAETSSNGALALFYRAGASAGGCSFPVNTSATEIVTAAGSTMMPGVVRLPSSGRYAIVFLAATARPFTPVTVSYLDLQTGVQTVIAVPHFDTPQSLQIPRGGGRVIANDGTAVIAISDGFGGPSIGYVVKPGAPPQPFPVAGALPLLIDASGTKVVYQNQGYWLLDLTTQQSTRLLGAEPQPAGLSLSDDGRLLEYLREGQVHVLDTGSGADRMLTADGAGITEAALSADGSVAWAVTGVGRLLRIRTGDGSQTEIIGRTPYLQPQAVAIVPGMTAQLVGSGLSDSTLNGTPPLQPFLGPVTMWIGERKVPLVQVTPTSVAFIVPWDISGPIRMLAETPGERTPFYYPEVETVVGATLFPVAGPIARQDWTRTFSGPVNTGEIIHVFALGFGPVSPEVPEGAAAPSAEPFARVTQPLGCSNAEVLYAGLAPYAVERIYQIDLRIGPVAGYQKFTCTLGAGAPFVFLTLNVVQ